MSDDFGVDLDEVFKVIDNAEVLVVRLQTTGKRILVDFRIDAENPPFIGLVPRATSIEERIRSVKQLRPSFPYPEKFMSFHWQRTVPLLDVSGVWQHLAERLERVGGEAAAEAATRVYRELLDEERAQVVGAIRGSDEWQTIWQRE